MHHMVGGFSPEPVNAPELKGFSLSIKDVSSRNFESGCNRGCDLKDERN